MAIEVVRSGSVVLAVCELRTPGICQYPDQAGPVFCYDIGVPRLLNVCKSCADYKYSTGEWILPGAREDQQTLTLQKFLLEMTTAYSVEQKLDVARSYAENRWAVRIPLSAGDYKDSFWVTDVHFGQFGWIRIALDGEDITTPAVVLMRPVGNLRELEATDGAILFEEHRLQ